MMEIIVFNVFFLFIVFVRLALPAEPPSILFEHVSPDIAFIFLFGICFSALFGWCRDLADVANGISLSMFANVQQSRRSQSYATIGCCIFVWNNGNNTKIPFFVRKEFWLIALSLIHIRKNCRAKFVKRQSKHNHTKCVLLTISYIMAVCVYVCVSVIDREIEAGKSHQRRWNHTKIDTNWSVFF